MMGDYIKAEQMRRLIVILWFLWPAFSFGQADIYQLLKLQVRLDEAFDSVQCKFVENEVQQHDINIICSTKYRFFPEGADERKTFNFNLDSTGKVCSIVIVGPIDSSYFASIGRFLGTPSFDVTANAGRVLKWEKEQPRVTIFSFYDQQYLVIYRTKAKRRDFMKFRFNGD
jgi:hypothetical protein